MPKRRRRRAIGPVTYVLAAVSIGAILLIGCGHAPRISGPASPASEPAFSKLGDPITPNTGENSIIGGEIITDNNQTFDGGFDVLNDNIVNDTPGLAGS